jgi:hypothetical protein
MDLPLNYRGSPGEAGAKNHQQNQIPASDPPGTDGFIKGNGD